jgi:hypothetical protein
MSIENRNLKPGTKLVARYKGKDYSAEVVKTEDGVRYRLADGREFKSPSSAGSAVMGGSACNGWRFWTLASEAAKKTPRPAQKKAKADRVFEAMDDQTGAPEGQVRYFCTACMKGFSAPQGVVPLACPDGHKNEA